MRADRGFRGAGYGAQVFLLLLLAALHSCPTRASSGLTPEGGDWETLGGRELAVLHHPDDVRYAGRVLEIYDDRAASMAASMGLPTLSPLRVFIASTDAEFSELSFHGAPDWGVGCALVGRGLVVLKSPRIVDYPLQMESVVEHEFAHIAAGKVLRGVDVPRWFDEGVAQAIAGEWRTGQAGALAAAAASGTLPALSALETAFPPEPRDAAQAYAVSFQAVRFIMDTAGAATAGELVSAVAEAGDFDAAIDELTGFGPSEFERAFGEFVSRRFTWGTLLNDGRTIFALVALLFLVTFIVRIRRSRGRMRAWAEEERGTGAASTRRRAPRDSRWT